MEYDIIKTENPKSLGGLTLAFFGDSVYEVLVRRRIIEKGNMPVDKLHKAAVKMVNAGFQSQAYDAVEGSLTEDEREILKRGRNATGNHIPRSASPKDYRKATGLEALFGYLYLTAQTERINYLFDIICTLDSEQQGKE